MNHPMRIESAGEEPARFTIDEFMRIVDSGAMDGAGKLELVEGVIVRLSPATQPHMRFQRHLYEDLRDAYRAAGTGQVVQFELTVQLGDATLRDIDVGVMESEFAEEDKFGDPQKVLLAAEIAVTSASYDLRQKQVAYAQAGIPHYWVVEASRERIHVMREPSGNGYASQHVIAFGDPLPVPGTDRTIAIG